MALAAAQNGRDVLLGVGDVLDAHNTAEENVLLGVFGGGGDDAGAVDEEDALHQGDVLPDLGLTWDGRDLAHLLLPQGIDDGRLAGVGVADEADGYLLAVLVQLRELAQQLDQRPLTERVSNGGMECQRGTVLREVFYPCSLRVLVRSECPSDADDNRDVRFFTTSNGIIGSLRWPCSTHKILRVLERRHTPKRGYPSMPGKALPERETAGGERYYSSKTVTGTSVVDP